MTASTHQRKKPSYIAIEGCIGVGKTTLCTALAKRFFGERLLEKVEENPFLADFYSNPKDHAFKTQLFFLLSRYNQQQVLKQQDLFSQTVVADYFIAKDRIFAELNLEGNEFKLYDQFYQALFPQLQMPEIIIYLRAPINVILNRIEKRGRAFEKNIESQYLNDLMGAYDRYFAQFQGCPVLIVDTEELNFPERQQDIVYVIDAISETLQQKKSQHLVNAGQKCQQVLFA